MPVLTTKTESTTAAQTNTSDLSCVSSSGSETTVNANNKPVSATPTGTAQQGTIASSELSLPKVDVPAVTKNNTANAVCGDGRQGKWLAPIWRGNGSLKRLRGCRWWPHLAR
jgi:hypothetical protein